MSSDASRDVGRRLGALRAGRGMSQGTLARLSGIPQPSLSRIENGRVRPTLATTERILDALKVGWDEVLGTPLSPTAEQCPVSPCGACLADLVRSEAEVVRDRRGTAYTEREVNLLRRLAAWMRAAPPGSVRALETVLDDLLKE